MNFLARPARRNVKTRVVHGLQGSEALGILALAGLVLIGQGRGNAQVPNGNNDPGNFQASSLANALQVSVFGGMGFPINLVTWNKYSNTQSSRVVSYWLWRNSGVVELLQPRAEGNTEWYFDGDTIPQGTPGCTFLDEILTVDYVTGSPAWNTDIVDHWNPDPTTGKPTYADWVKGHNLAGQIWSTGATGVDSWVEFSWYPDALVANYPDYYQIQPIIVVNTPASDGTPNWMLQRTTTASSPSNQVYPCMAGFPDQAMLVGSVASFLFYHTLGSDEMELEVQRDQGNGSQINFATNNNTTYTQIVPGLNAASRGDLVTVQVPLSTLEALSSANNSSVYWWRVGATNRADSVKPRPWPLTLTNDFNYVWSFPLAQVTLSPTAARSVHGGRNDAQAIQHATSAVGSSASPRRATLQHTLTPMASDRAGSGDPALLSACSMSSSPIALRR